MNETKDGVQTLNDPEAHLGLKAVSQILALKHSWTFLKYVKVAVIMSTLDFMLIKGKLL